MTKLKSISKPVRGNRGKKLFQGSVTRTINTITSIIIAFFMFPFLVHNLGDKTYGLLVLVMAFVDYYNLLRLGFSSAVVRYISRAVGLNDNKEKSEVVSTAFFIYLIISFLMLIFTGVLYFSAGALVKNPQNIQLFQILILILGFKTAMAPPLSVYAAIINAHLQFKIIEYVNIIELIVKSALTVYFVTKGYGLIAIAIIYLCTRFARSTFFIFYNKKHYRQIKIKLSLWKNHIFKKLLPYSIYTFIAQLADTLKFKVDALVISIYLGLTLVTHYSIASRLISYYSLFILTAIGVFQNYFSQEEGKGNFQSIRENFFFATKISCYLSVFIGTSIIIYGKPFIQRWMGTDYLDAYNLLIVLSIASIINLAQFPTALVLYGISKNKFYALISLIEGLFNLGISLLLVKKFGMLGVALGTAIPMILIKLFIQPLYITKVLEINKLEYFKKLGVYLLLPLTVLGVYYLIVGDFIKPNYLIIGLAGFFQLIIFILIGYWFGFRKTERAKFLSILSK